jgi:hypothetical protein
MKCHRCQTGIPHWRTHCPQCGLQLLPLPYATANATDAARRPRRSLPLLKMLRLSLLVVALVGLAVVAKLNSAQTSGQVPAPNVEAEQRAAAVAAPSPHTTGQVSEEVSAPPATSEQSVDTTADTAASPTARARAAVLPSAPTPARKSVPSTDIAVAATTPGPTANNLPPSNAAPPARVAETARPHTAPPATAARALAGTPTATAPAPGATVGAGLEVEGASVELSPRTAMLTIKSYVPARIYINGEFSGVTPRTVKLLAGEHTVTLVADGYQEWARKVKLSGQQQAGILASLKKPSPAGNQ